MNVADYVTRGLTVETLVKCETWWHGPKLLVEPETNWPENNCVIVIVSILNASENRQI